MIRTSTRPQRRREFLRSRSRENPLNNRLDQGPVRLYERIGPSRYMPHIGEKELSRFLRIWNTGRA